MHANTTAHYQHILLLLLDLTSLFEFVYVNVNLHLGYAYSTFYLAVLHNVGTLLLYCVSETFLSTSQLSSTSVKTITLMCLVINIPKILQANLIITNGAGVRTTDTNTLEKESIPLPL